jgi:predicted lipoprotein
LIPSLNKAIEIDTLITLLKKQPEKTFNAYSHALGIGNLKYFLVKGNGKVLSVGENSVTVLVNSATAKNVIEIATEYVYGNAIRDASGIISMNEFDNTMNFNEVSASINKIVRTKVLPDFITTVKKGAAVQFAGAIELNKKHLSLKEIEVVPIALKIIN